LKRNRKHREMNLRRTVSLTNVSNKKGSLHTPSQSFSSSKVSNNDFFKDFCSMISNPDFQFFRQKYMKDWSDVETLFLYLTTTDLIRAEYKSRYSKPIENDQLCLVLQQIFSSNVLRKIAIDRFRDYQTSGARFITSSDDDSKGLLPPPSSSQNQDILPRRLPSYVFKI